jgi:hypothetical protein
VATGFIAAAEVLSGEMATVLKRAEEYARRWAEGNWQAVREGLERPRDQAHYDWALGFAAGDLRKLTRKANRQAIITLSAAILKEAGLVGADRVRVWTLPEGGLFVRRATAEDVSEAHAGYAATPQPRFPARPALAELPELEKLCPQCGLTFRTRQRRRVYCDPCKRQRDLKSRRATWHRRGKLRPSYQRKLKGARLAWPRPAVGSSSILIRPT